MTTALTTTATTELSTFFSAPVADLREDPQTPERIDELLHALEAGQIRAAEQDARGDWHANAWVKTGILAAFALSETIDLPGWPGGAVDKSLVPPRQLTAADGVRVVPGGTSVRRGAHLAPGVVVMPPSYANTGSFVGAGSMVDSHVLVGSCAQVGQRVHLSAAVQLGGVLEPIGARPVIVEDDAFIGAQCGLYEGVLVRHRAVLAPGVVLTSRTTIHDLVNGRDLRGEVPAGAVVVPGSRPARGEYAERLGLSVYAPVIVKFRDDSTDASTVLEEVLR
ncbi:2,3,4,5-tetrahydropyridine-2,6-dicarboxylate N-succinyltransferase [Ornithinimicrobium cryptoxanthini]|uniref:2,3,4,5-tetrahydropyridine-2,6-dicarboxylate N-succinyltransferase n=1 Tax=Ornithinimicrobium cryptoxanthini TaxID=2934161 RepID=A0ABY4YM62_9MICO|nr:2,3,4,5-tetrahydropyridine-2,6-dicarboxylate N-succinyltransferase [Ornithinimicrobium cryptoxanthini]USQ77360.1 2,3,4,5-tetrahydropyridine-2,6-dicarboxylate N-succinyltransferase [Ornithinimicrobium cryptoxanthini]